MKKLLVLILLIGVNCFLLYSNNFILIFKHNTNLPVLLEFKDIECISHDKPLSQTIKIKRSSIETPISDIDSVVIMNSYLSCPDDAHPHLIDLGLPSGTKWACCNINAQKPEDFGGYYSWGETWEKSNYDWNNYSYWNAAKNSCSYIGNDIAGTSYDVAHVEWGGAWTIPSYSQIIEIMEDCEWKWKVLNDVCGQLVIGKNGGMIFLPAAGFRIDDNFASVGLCGCYWESGHNPNIDSKVAATFTFGTVVKEEGRSERRLGRSLRAVSVKNEVNRISTTQDEVVMLIGHTNIVRIRSGNGNYVVSCDNSNVAKVSLSNNKISITALSVGIATITIEDDLGQIDHVTVKVEETPPSYLSCPDNNHPHLIDLGLPSGTKWACCNINASFPYEYGGYYAWGETEEKDVYTLDTYSFYDNNMNKYVRMSNISGTQYDVAHMKWGHYWQMPSGSHISELKNNCSSVYGSLNDVNGLYITGPNGGSIFLPAAGCYWESLQNVGVEGYYWASGLFGDNKNQYAYYLTFRVAGFGLYHDYRQCGFPVRPICP